MGVNEIRSVIEGSAAELRAAGLSALYLFGSQARGESGAESDIDLAFDVSDAANERFSLIDQSRLQLRLQELFGRKVDFIERKGFKPRMREIVERDMVRLM